MPFTISLCGQILRNAQREYLIVVRSTLLPGILEERLIPMLEEALSRPLDDTVSVCNNPEFLREGHAINDYNSPPFILVGAADSSAAPGIPSARTRVTFQPSCLKSWG